MQTDADTKGFDPAHVDTITDPLTASHRKHLHDRGLSDQTIAAARLFSVSPAEASDILGQTIGCPGIALPYQDPFNKTASLTRIRPDKPPIFKGKPAKYLSPRGAGNAVYYPPESESWIKNPSVEIGITEGEFKTLAAYQAEMTFVGLSGVTCWRGKDSQTGKSGPITDLDLIPWRDRFVSICFDSDTATNPNVLAARDGLAKEPYRRGARRVHAINLPELKGAKCGLDDYLDAYDVEAFFALDVEEISSPYPPVRLWKGTELQSATIERPAPIVPGWGIRKCGKVLLTGVGGRGKSTLLLQIACNLAAGRPLLGYAGLAVAGPQRVVVYMAEDPLSEVKFRWVKQMRALGYGDEIADRIAFLEAPDSILMLTDEARRTVLFDAFRQHQATVAILDPLVSLHDQDENSNSAMREVLDLFTPYQAETGCTFIIAHHEPKNAESNSAAARGASSIRDWCRTMLRLGPLGKASAEVQRFNLALDKANYGGNVRNVTLERQQDSYLFTPFELETSVTSKQICEILGQDGEWLEATKSTIMERFGVAEATARRAIEKAEDQNLIQREKIVNEKTRREKTYLTRCRE